MEAPEEIELRLQRALSPRGFSTEGMEAIEEMLDVLAVESDQRASFSGHRWAWLSGSVAAGVALAFGITWMNSGVEPLVTDQFFQHIEPVSLVSEEEGVVSAEVESGLFSDRDGNLMRAWHVQVVNQERFHDPQTGHEVTVVRPRDEVVLMPVSSF